MLTKDYLPGEVVLTNHDPSRRGAITGTEAIGCTTTPEAFKDIFLVNDGVYRFQYPKTRVWIAEDRIPSGGASRWMEAMDVRFPPDPDFHDGSIPLWRLAAQIADQQSKKFMFVITNEYLQSDPDMIQAHGQFTADVLNLLSEVPGAWGGVGSPPTGTVDQHWFENFMVPDLVDALKAGKGAFILHEYAYAANPAGLMRYLDAAGVEWSFLAPTFMGPHYQLADRPGNQPKAGNLITLPPVPTPENLIEAHLIGRAFKYCDIPPWLPIFIGETGSDRIGLAQAQAWGAPWKYHEETGESEVYGGIVDLQSLISRTWANGGNAGYWYAVNFLGWLNSFYSQWEQVYGLESWCTGDNYGQWEDMDGDEIGAWDYSRRAIRERPLVERIPAWEYAQHVLSQEPPAEPPPHEPPPDPIYVPYQRKLFTKQREAEGYDKIWNQIAHLTGENALRKKEITAIKKRLGME